jgi:hypothetical protein
MSLGPAEIADLVALGAPVLCVDTCTILDVIRDITRETVRLADASAGLALLSAAETRAKLVVLVAEQVEIELASNLPDVQQEAEDKLNRFRTAAQRIYDVAAAYGASGSLLTSTSMGTSAEHEWCWIDGRRLLRGCRTTPLSLVEHLHG